MIHIDFVEPNTPIWKQWRRDCEKALVAANEDAVGGEKIEISDIYRKRAIKRDIYMHKNGPFNGKCAYCECYLKDFQHGDMEHFRPKKGVTDHEDNPITRTNVDGEEESHPGYYWLAYEWRNLMPSCIACNQATEVDGQKVGKHNRFPVNGDHAFDAASLAAEQPLLINPLEENPSDHFAIDTDTGLLVEKTDKGGMTIRVFALNIRDRLPENRARAIDHVKAALVKLLHNPEKRQEAVDEIKRIRAGKTEYAAAANAYLDEITPQLRSIFA